MRRPSMDTGYFDALYAQGDGDPWSFATSSYEQRKYEATLAALPRPRYKRVLEIGCSIGILTQMLSARCDELVATEPAARALAQAKARCSAHDNIRFEQMSAPDTWPDGSFDLILLSEVVYYLTRTQVEQLAGRVGSSLAPAGHVELVHWIRETDYPLSGDDAVTAFAAASEDFLTIIRQERTEDYRLDLFERCQAVVVEGAGG